MKAKLHYVLAITMVLFAFSAFSQNPTWKPIAKVKNSQKIKELNIEKAKANYFLFDSNSFRQKVNTVANRSSKNKNTIISLPVGKGKTMQFNIYEASVFSPELAAKFPEIKSYVGYDTKGSGTKLRMSVSPEGVQTMITSIDKSRIFMQPLKKGLNEYVVYEKENQSIKGESFTCNTIETLKTKSRKTSKSALVNEGGANTKTLQKFRIAISVTAEYTTFHGGTVAGALAAINATLSRVNEIFEADMAVTFELVDATQLIYTDASTDPYSPPIDRDNWNNELQTTLTNTIGNGAYDIGHLFGDSGGGGSAGCVGCVCDDNIKGSAYTSPANDIPQGDTFDIDYVAHEIGHQMGAYHTFAWEDEFEGVSSEPGSGSTIMAYAGLQGNDNVATNSDTYFHYHSIKQILNNLTSKSCQTTESITNNPPSADAGNNYTIPAGTPYILKGSATDSDSGDILTYCWEQTDSGMVDHLNFGPTLTVGSMNRSLPPTTSPNRYIPRLSSVLHGKIIQTNPGLGSDWETVANIDRTLNWALTVRDRDPLSTSVGQTSYDTMQITVTDGTVSNPVGPFEVTSQSSTGISWTQNTNETITWNVAGTDANGINTSFVNILLSTDGGVTFDTVLASNTPNDGSEIITVPNIAAPFCRIMVEPIGNIYYSVNSFNFAIGYTVTTTCNQQFSSGSLGLNIPDNSAVTNNINIPSSDIISSVKVNVDVTHDYISDLKVTLTHPNGTTSSLIWNENCFLDTGYANFDITFDDNASPTNCASPTVGTYIPYNPLNIFEGLDIQGNWELSVEDVLTGDEGILNDWYLDFCITTTTLSTDDIENNSSNLKIAPNPSNGEFIITYNNPSHKNDLKVEVFDLRGRSIYKNTFKNPSNSNKKIDLKNIQSGIYILSFSDGLKTTTKKIIIK